MYRLVISVPPALLSVGNRTLVLTHTRGQLNIPLEPETINALQYFRHHHLETSNPGYVDCSNDVSYIIASLESDTVVLEYDSFLELTVNRDYMASIIRQLPES